MPSASGAFPLFCEECDYGFRNFQENKTGRPKKSAVNGVINIITKRAQDTQGAFATAAIGTADEGYEALRYGGKIKDGMYFTVSGKRMTFGTVDNPNQTVPRYGMGGFRLVDCDVTGPSLRER